MPRLDDLTVSVHGGAPTSTAAGTTCNHPMKAVYLRHLDDRGLLPKHEVQHRHDEEAEDCWGHTCCHAPNGQLRGNCCCSCYSPSCSCCGMEHRCGCNTQEHREQQREGCQNVHELFRMWPLCLHAVLGTAALVLAVMWAPSVACCCGLKQGPGVTCLCLLHAGAVNALWAGTAGGATCALLLTSCTPSCELGAHRPGSCSALLHSWSLACCAALAPCGWLHRRNNTVHNNAGCVTTSFV